MVPNRLRSTADIILFGWRARWYFASEQHATLNFSSEQRVYTIIFIGVLSTARVEFSVKTVINFFAHNTMAAEPPNRSRARITRADPTLALTRHIYNNIVRRTARKINGLTRFLPDLEILNIKR